MDFDLTKSKLNDVYVVVKKDTLPFVVTFRCPSPSACRICVTDDGKKFWLKNVNIEDIKKLTNNANNESVETTCKRLRFDLNRGRQVLHGGLESLAEWEIKPWCGGAPRIIMMTNVVYFSWNHIYNGEIALSYSNGDNSWLLTIGKGSLLWDVQMQRSTEDERDHLVKDLLFAMASHSSQQTRKLDTLNTKDICSQSLNTFNPQTSTSSRGQAIKRRPKTGMSLINPNSKLSKTQKGIAFD